MALRGRVAPGGGTRTIAIIGLSARRPARPRPPRRQNPDPMFPKPPDPARPAQRSPTRIGLLAALVVLFVVAVLGATVWLAADYQRNEREEALMAATETAIAALRGRLGAAERALGQIAHEIDPAAPAARFEAGAARLLADDPSLLRIEMRNSDGALIAAADPVDPRPRIAADQRGTLGFETTLAKHSAMTFSRAVYSRPYYVSASGGLGFEVTDLAVPWDTAAESGSLLAIRSLPRMLDRLLPADFERAHQITLIESDGTLVARTSSGLIGAGVYVVSAPLELPGVTLLLRVNSLERSPGLVPGMLAASLVALVLGLASSGLLLWRDTRRRLAAEQALREQQAFRKAMEDSLVTGLYAYDLEGRITYVNPAFCEMTGYRAEALLGAAPPIAPADTGTDEPPHRPGQGIGTGRQGFEIELQRRDGERFPALVFEAALIDESGRQTGWMGSILDIGERRRVEELNRRQQEKLQAHARMAMLGEVATALSHELNQPLAAITSYATACENLLLEDFEPDPRARDRAAQRTILRSALERIRSQSERAGQVIHGVQAFVRRRRIEREPIAIDALLRDIEPLVRLQARKWNAQLVFRIDGSPLVCGDRTMLEQALLNLTRNGAEAMDGIPPLQRMLTVESGAHREAERDWVRVSVSDLGCGVAPEAEPQLFQPFFTTKPEGLGIGLSLSRSVIEAHGGQLRRERRDGPGSVFSILLPLHRPAPARREMAGLASEALPPGP